MLKLKLNTLATWCKELTHLKRPWCWKRLKAGREEDGRGLRSLYAITDVMDMSLSRLWALVMDREAWRAAVHGVTKSRTRVSTWNELNWIDLSPIKAYWASQVALVVKNPPANTGYAGDVNSISVSGRSPGGGNGNPLQFSCLENPMDRRSWWPTVHRVVQSWTRLK